MVMTSFQNVSYLVLLLTLGSLVSARSLRTIRETDHKLPSGNTSETHSTAVGEAESARNTTTVTPEALNQTDQTNISITTNYPHPPEFNHTISKGTENMIERVPTTSYQLTTADNSTWLIAQKGSSTPTFPPSSKTTEKHVTREMPTTTNRKSGSGTTHSCTTKSSQGDALVSRCLIAIASMAALTTIFIMSTICLATQLSGYKYRHKAHLLQETEMVCISDLVNDSEHPVPKPRRHPKSNGALIPEAEGDNLTLNSFLPETEGTL
ncbi:hypothetical protein DNTS_002250 [Danionella cerebrum]|uniref:Selectin P ligand n=1 Tax=Danionella cerebrum TaxID=2873325 RepID=A0A553P0V1_9TELE|nr:hypothetical protein DNTS_002250 [Danionella translucida]